MRRRFFLKSLSVIALSVSAFNGLAALKNSGGVARAQGPATSGSLQALDKNGKPKAECPLKHTDVRAEISGFLSRVVVTQEFENSFAKKIEAVHTFPLPQNAAVDDMTMIVGDRTVRGKILRREEAEAVYEAAKTGGQSASLLNQERPNIFTQSVANILPGEQIKITISYVETLKYENGSYEFVFPMVVGPRYIPGSATGGQESTGGNGFAPDTDRVPDASRITPQPVPEGMRGGHDISFDLTVDAGVPIDGLNSKTHDVDIERTDDHRARIRLRGLFQLANSARRAGDTLGAYSHRRSDESGLQRSATGYDAGGGKAEHHSTRPPVPTDDPVHVIRRCGRNDRYRRRPTTTDRCAGGSAGGSESRSGVWTRTTSPIRFRHWPKHIGFLLESQRRFGAHTNGDSD